MAASVVEFLKLGYHLRGMQLKLLETNSGKRKGNLEIVAVFFYHVKERIERRHIRTLGYFAYASVVLIVVIIVMVCSNVKETVSLQMDYLVYFKI